MAAAAAAILMCVCMYAAVCSFPVLDIHFKSNLLSCHRILLDDRIVLSALQVRSMWG